MNIIELKDINQSFTHIKINGDIEYGKILIDTLSVYEDGYQFNPNFRNGAWDGKKHFFSILPNQIFEIPLGLTPYIIRDLEKREKKYIYDKNKDIESKINMDELSSFIKNLNLPFPPYDYQEEAIINSINDKRLVLSSATGSGKSLIIYIIIRWMLKEKKRTLISVPSIGLVSQMSADFKEYGWDEVDDFLNKIGGDFKGDKTLSQLPITITTWQSAQYFNKDNFNNIDCIIIDEAHALGSGDILDNIVKNAKNSKWKIGMTGTVPRIRTDKLQLLGTLGPVKKIINARGLIDKGLATDVIINCIYLNYSKNMVDEYYKNNGNRPKYPDEEKYITTNLKRNKKVAEILLRISKSGNTIGLFSKTAHGELILKNVIEERTGNTNITLLHKLTPKPIKEAFDIFKEDKHKIFYINKKITLADRKKIMTNVKKLSDNDKDIELFMKNIKSLDDENIFFYNGSVDSETREYIRKKLEDIEGEKIVLEYNSNTIELQENEKVILSNGSSKKASEITYEDDISVEWLKDKKLTIEMDEKPNRIYKKSNGGKYAIVIANYAVMKQGISIKRLHNVVLLSSLKAYTTIVQVIGRLLRLHKDKKKAYLYDIVDIIDKVGKRGGITQNYVQKHFYQRLEFYREEGYNIRENELNIK